MIRYKRHDPLGLSVKHRRDRSEAVALEHRVDNAKQSRPPWWERAWLEWAVLLAALLLYAESLPYGFVDPDDHQFFLQLNFVCFL